jgi:hypothetical protein
MLDYNRIADGYEKDAENLKKTIDKYKAQLKGRKINREALNKIIDSYELIYYDLIGTAADMRKRGNKQ